MADQEEEKPRGAHPLDEWFWDTGLHGSSQGRWRRWTDFIFRSLGGGKDKSHGKRQKPGPEDTDDGPPTRSPGMRRASHPVIHRKTPRHHGNT